MSECVHCWDDGTPVYPHDEHETREAYMTRMETDLIREALALARVWDAESAQDGTREPSALRCQGNPRIALERITDGLQRVTAVSFGTVD